jgi:sec-independent protein translocase protein TatA
MGLSFFHIVVVLLVVLILFGAGRLPHVMGDLGKGIRAFKEGMKGDQMEGEKPASPQIEADKEADKKDKPEA